MDFVENYNSFLLQNKDIIRRSLILHHEDPAYLFFKDRFKKIYHALPEEKKPDLMVSATDGSEFSRELYNGQKLVVSRAISIIEGKEVEEDSFHLMRVDREQKNEIVKRIMENLEHMAAMRTIKEESAELCLMDGSLSGRLYWRTKIFDTDLKPDIYEDYIKKLKDFISMVLAKKVILVFIGKTSDTTILKRNIIQNEKELPDFIVGENITDHLIVKSIAEFPGYTEPVFVEKQIDRESTIEFFTMHVLPSMDDTPLKIDYIIPEGSPFTVEDIVSWIRWSYTGLKNHNLWISLADKKVKFHRIETEDIIMKLFMKAAGIDEVETRGERRARIRF
ncbi:MAG: DNA double-strand break repair nuclease NurA [Cuniculiplasma sp.]